VTVAPSLLEGPGNGWSRPAAPITSAAPAAAAPPRRQRAKKKQASAPESRARSARHNSDRGRRADFLGVDRDRVVAARHSAEAPNRAPPVFDPGFRVRESRGTFSSVTGCSVKQPLGPADTSATRFLLPTAPIVPASPDRPLKRCIGMCRPTALSFAPSQRPSVALSELSWMIPPAWLDQPPPHHFGEDIVASSTLLDPSPARAEQPHWCLSVVSQSWPGSSRPSPLC